MPGKKQSTREQSTGEQAEARMDHLAYLRSDEGRFREHDLHHEVQFSPKHKELRSSWPGLDIFFVRYILPHIPSADSLKLFDSRFEGLRLVLFCLAFEFMEPCQLSGVVDLLPHLRLLDTVFSYYRGKDRQRADSSITWATITALKVCEIPLENTQRLDSFFKHNILAVLKDAGRRPQSKVTPMSNQGLKNF